MENNSYRFTDKQQSAGSAFWDIRPIDWWEYLFGKR